MATNLLAQIERLWANLQGLGVRRLTALAVIGAAAFAVTGLAGYYLSRPTMETLYSGLDRDDIAAIGAALREAGVPFDVNAESTVVLTPAGQTAAARMILAEKGLPRSGAVGNELFDKLGSLGLTSFMQDVTRLRALEGELARTIQMMRTVKAARVHIVLADEGSFRRERQPSSASVVIRTDGGDDRATGQAIRHLVAAAVPGMKLDDVTVLNVDGRLLASGPEFDREVAGQPARARKGSIAGNPRQRHPHADALSQLPQFSDLGRRPAERRQDTNERDDLQSR